MVTKVTWFRVDDGFAIRPVYSSNNTESEPSGQAILLYSIAQGAQTSVVLSNDPRKARSTHYRSIAYKRTEKVIGTG